MSPAIQWFKLQIALQELNELPGVADWLEDVEDVLYSAFNRSNFYEAISEYFLDAASIGTATLFVEEDVQRDRILFSSRHPKEIFLAEDRSGQVDTVYRRFELTARQAVQQFGSASHPDVIDLAEKNPYQKIVIIHAVYPRSERKQGRIDQLNKAFSSVYIDVTRKHMLREGGYDQMPYLVWRWRKNSDETYGRSPASDAISDVLRLNHVGKTMIQAAQLAVEPPYNVPEGIKGYEQLVPGGFNYYDDPTKIVSPIAVGGNYPIGRDQEQRIEEIIDDHFHTDFFLMLSRAEREMTAREVIERQGEKAAVLGTTIGRLNSECLQPLIDRVFAIEFRNGNIPSPPDILLEYQANIDVELMGPLAQAQRRYHQSQGVARGTEAILPILQIDPNTLDNIDTDELLRQTADAQGMPQKIIREKPDVERIRQQRAAAQKQAIAEQQAQITQENVMKNLDKLNQPVAPGSMLQDMNRQLQAAQPQPRG